MEPFEIPGSVAGTALRFEPSATGKLIMTAWSLDRSGLGGHASVILDPEWLRPLAAWFAGEAEPGIVSDDEYGTQYGCWLAVAGDEAAVVTSTHTEARLECLSPYGHARVTLGQRGRTAARSLTVMLTPEARADVAAWLRRVDAESWPELPVR